MKKADSLALVLLMLSPGESASETEQEHGQDKEAGIARHRYFNRLLDGAIGDWVKENINGAGGRDWAGEIKPFPLPLWFLPGTPNWHFIWSISFYAEPCCHKDGKFGLMYTAEAGFETYLQWGKTIQTTKHNVAFNPLIESAKKVPTRGFKDRTYHLNLGTGGTKPCPDHFLDFKEFYVKGFLRGSGGAGFGYQFNVSTTWRKGEDFNVETLWRNRSAQGSRAWGLLGLSIELGAGAYLAFDGTMF